MNSWVIVAVIVIGYEILKIYGSRKKKNHEQWKECPCPECQEQGMCWKKCPNLDLDREMKEHCLFGCRVSGTVDQVQNQKDEDSTM